MPVRGVARTGVVPPALALGAGRMTPMTVNLTALGVAWLVCVTAVYLWHEAKPLLLRLLAVHEHRYAPPVAVQPNDTPTAAESDIALPPDLAAICAAYGASEHTQWAVEQSEARVRELYAFTGGDWDRVREIFGAEQRATTLGSTMGGNA